ncbi:hypothetical protein FJTKL_03013 [Diaporthe vaccinii]|uniref:Uncharacterized protein n=1 Tax=Diaporthe vaccinii TaxID=105482 RepID=A0ABR4DWJ4_9PEZI
MLSDPSCHSNYGPLWFKRNKPPSILTSFPIAVLPVIDAADTFHPSQPFKASPHSPHNPDDPDTHSY